MSTQTGKRPEVSVPMDAPEMFDPKEKKKSRTSMRGRINRMTDHLEDEILDDEYRKTWDFPMGAEFNMGETVTYVKGYDHDERRQRLLYNIQELDWRRSKTESGLFVAVVQHEKEKMQMLGMMRFEGQQAKQGLTADYEIRILVLTGKFCFELEDCLPYKSVEKNAIIKIPESAHWQLTNLQVDESYVYFFLRRPPNGCNSTPNVRPDL